MSKKLMEVVTSAPGIRDAAIFHGEGFARYLISGRTLPSQWEAIATGLADAINALGLNLYRGTRTITYISALARPVDRREQLLLREQGVNAQAESLDELLGMEESRLLEFKASAYLDVRRAISGDSRRDESKRMNDGIIRTVAGLLNGQGGRLVIGVAEASDFTLDDLQSIFPRAVAVREYIVIGVDNEYPRKGWDGYQRRLRRLLKDHITPDPTEWVDYAPAEHAAGTVVILIIRRPDKWYYARSVTNPDRQSRFYARIGNETNVLDGPDMDAYRERNPRTTGSPLREANRRATL